MTNKGFSKKLHIYLPVLFAIILVAGIFLGINLNFGDGGSKPGTKFFSIGLDSYNKVNDVINYINESYVDSVNRKDLEERTIEKLIKSLDPHSSYIPATDFREMNDPLMGSFEGIGIEFNMIDDTVMVINPIPGGPSEKIGLMAGDRIVKVNEKTIAGVAIATNEVVRMLKGEKGTQVDVHIYRRGVDDLLPFTIIRDKIPSYSLDIAYMADDNIGYLKLSRFSATTHSEFRNAVERLKLLGMSAMILDLRGNVGGFLEAAIEVADELLEPRKLIVYTDGRKRPRSYANARRNGIFEKQPLIILIDEWSASASEIIAGAIQDNDRGIVIGRRSFGKGLVQEQVQLGDGSALRLTVARYYTPTGRSIQTPYQIGDPEGYISDFADRFLENGINYIDSIKQIDSLKFETPAGRIVYGGGGIMPDIYLPLQYGENFRFFNLLINKGLIYRFAFDYADRNRDRLSKYENAEDYIQKFKINNDISNEFIKYVSDNGVRINTTDFNKSKDLINNYLKAYIGRNMFGNEAFYPVLHLKDQTFKKALEIIKSDKLLSYLEPQKSEQ